MLVRTARKAHRCECGALIAPGQRYVAEIANRVISLGPRRRRVQPEDVFCLGCHPATREHVTAVREAEDPNELLWSLV